jgi:hypothetical protein
MLGQLWPLRIQPLAQLNPTTITCCRKVRHNDVELLLFQESQRLIGVACRSYTMITAAQYGSDRFKHGLVMIDKEDTAFPSRIRLAANFKIRFRRRRLNREFDRERRPSGRYVFNADRAPVFRHDSVADAQA